MNCPACNASLNSLSAGDIVVEVCDSGCGGIWFDKDELDKFDEPHEFSTHEILQIAKKNENNKVDVNKVKNCPKCPNEVLVKQFLDHKNEIVMDQCWKCSGIWLDVGEINTLRGQYTSIEERRKAVETYVQSNLVEQR